VKRIPALEPIYIHETKIQANLSNTTGYISNYKPIHWN